MELERLMTRYFQLQQELAAAYKHRPWESERIDALAHQLIRAELAIAARRPVTSGSTAGHFTVHESDSARAQTARQPSLNRQCAAPY